MTQEEGFPVLHAGDVAKVFPDLKAGDVIKVFPDDDLSDLDVGEFIVIQRTGDNLTYLPVDETDAVSGTVDEISARVSSVEDAAVTIEVMSTSDEGRPG